MKRLIAVMALLICVSFVDAYSQFGMNYSIVGGISTTKLLGDNAATKPFVTINEDDNDTYGGSFQEIQSGIDLHLVIPLDKYDFYRLPIGLDYTFYSSKELQHNKMYRSDGTIDGGDFVVSNKLNLLAVYTGLHYVIIKYPKYDINVFLGGEIRGNLMINNEYIATEIRSDDTERVTEFDMKDPAFRLGTKLLIGGEGKIKNNWYANFSFGLSIFNLIGRDNSTGEYLTPLSVFETKENLIYGFHFNLQFKYKFVK